MKETEKLFFELICVSIGTQDILTLLPSLREWDVLYKMAEKQSLVGVCFAGLQRLGADADEGFTRIGMSEMQYLTWMGMAVKIQQKNEIVDRQCVVLQKQLAADRFRSCVLKGQGVARLYSGELRHLRQAGDIDIWIEGDRDKVLDYFKRKGAKVSYTSIKHAQVEVFENTEVEVHSRPSWFYNPIHDRRWMKWVKEQEKRQFENIPVGGIVAPTVEFNLVFLLIHIYRHLFEEGVGLRQLMDYYFVLRTSYDKDNYNYNIKNTLASLGMLKFACAMMWVVAHIFANGNVDDNDNFFLGMKPDEKGGRFLLEEIMRGGNFGKYDKRYGGRTQNRIARGFATMKRNMRYISSYPSEILWAPVWKMWHWCWRKKHGYI